MSEVSARQREGPASQFLHPSIPTPSPSLSPFFFYQLRLRPDPRPAICVPLHTGSQGVGGGGVHGQAQLARQGFGGGDCGPVATAGRGGGASLAAGPAHRRHGFRCRAGSRASDGRGFGGLEGIGGCEWKSGVCVCVCVTRGKLKKSARPPVFPPGHDPRLDCPVRGLGLSVLSPPCSLSRALSPVLSHLCGGCGHECVACGRLRVRV